MEDKRIPDKISIQFAFGTVMIDVTDLFLLDFAIAKELVASLETIASQEGTTSARGRVAEAQQALCAALDRIVDRTIELARRLDSAATNEQPKVLSGSKLRLDQHYLSRQGLIALGAFRKDRFSRMDLNELRAAIGERKWAELHMRLVCSQPIDPKYLRRAAQWLLRGLNVNDAVIKSCMQSRRRQD